MFSCHWEDHYDSSASSGSWNIIHQIPGHLAKKLPKEIGSALRAWDESRVSSPVSLEEIPVEKEMSRWTWLSNSFLLALSECSSSARRKSKLSSILRYIRNESKSWGSQMWLNVQWQLDPICLLLLAWLSPPSGECSVPSFPWELLKFIPYTILIVQILWILKVHSILESGPGGIFSPEWQEALDVVNCSWNYLCCSLSRF